MDITRQQIAAQIDIFKDQGVTTKEDMEQQIADWLANPPLDNNQSDVSDSPPIDPEIQRIVGDLSSYPEFSELGDV